MKKHPNELDTDGEESEGKKSPNTQRVQKQSQQSEFGHESIVIGKIENSNDNLVSRQYLLPLNSPAIRGVFSNKDYYYQIAQELKGELEFTRIVATLKDKDWPKYTLIEIRSVDTHSLNLFESRILEINPEFAEKVTYDPFKYVCVQVISRPSSLYVHPGDISSSSLSDDSEGGGGGGKDVFNSPKDTPGTKRKKMTKKAGERERPK